MANYLVTGAAGFIGSALARRLLDEGHQVASIDNLSTGFLDNLPAGTSFVEGDCADSAMYQKIPQHKYDAILHIAGQSSGEVSFDDPIYDIRTNAESTLLLLKFALTNGCRRFIFASTMSVYGVKPDIPIDEDQDCAPESFYGVAKLASEHYMRIYQQYGIDSTALRLFNVYGPGQNLKNLRQGMVSIFVAQMFEDAAIQVKGSADRYRDFIYIDDVVDAFVNSIDCRTAGSQVINVATGVRTSVGELLQVIVSKHDQAVEIGYSGSTSGDIHGIRAEVVKMREILGINNTLDLEQGITKMLDWVRAVHDRQA